MSYDRDRGGRQEQYHDIGEQGRMTGVRAPKNVPRDSSGMEDPSAFMNSRQSGASSFGRPSLAYSAAANSPRMGPRPSMSPSKAGRGGRERPDLYLQDGERGRKTGVTVAYQERDEDGFEGMDAYFNTNSPTTAKKLKQSAKKVQRSPVRYDDYDYDDDAGDVDLVQANEYSPSAAIRGQQRANGQSLSSSSLRKTGLPANGRLSPARSDADDSDEQVRRATLGNRAASTNKSSSTLNRSANRRPISDDESEAEPAFVDTRRVLSSEDEQPAPRARKTAAAPNGAGSKSRASLGSLPSPVAAAPNRKGKERARTPEQEQEDNFYFDDQQQDYGGGDEDDYVSDGQGAPYGGESELEQIDEEQDDDEAGEDEDEQPRAKASKSKSKAKVPAKAKAKSKTSSKSKTSTTARERAAPAPKRRNGAVRSRSVQPEPVIERKRPIEEGSSDEDGVRRSRRQKIAPVEYWRNERVIYKRRASGLGMEAVVHIPKAEVESLTFKKKGNSRFRGDSVRPTSRAVKDEVYDEEDGVDDLTDPDGIVWSWEGNAETTRRIAFTGKMIDPRPTHNNKFMFQKIFTELDYLASGILQIPAGAEKPSKAARDNSYTFYCIQGSVSVVVHRSRFNIGPGGTFFVPRGNSYSITAISNRDVKLFFTQARRIYEGPNGETTRPDTQEEALARLEAEQDGQEEEEGEEEDGDEDEDGSD